MSIVRTWGFLGLILATLTTAPMRAAGADEVILTVRQVDAKGAVVKSTDFTMAQIEALGLRTMTTSTPWTKGATVFDGVPLAKVIGDTRSLSDIKIIALNDYAAAVPVGDFARYDVLLATRMAGRAIPVRDKGPLWSIYPLDERPEINNQRFHARMVWQIRTIEVR